MSMVRRRALAVVAAAAAGLGVSVVGIPAAHAIFPGYTYYVRSADFTAPTAAFGDASQSLEPDGVHIHTGDPSALVDGTFVPPGGPVGLGDFNQYGYQVQYQWTGSAAEPAVHYDLDLDGDGQADMELVGEHKYGPDDLWLNEGFYVAHPTVPLSTIEAAAPCVGTTTVSAFRQGCTTTYGGQYHGGILDWTSGLVGREGFSGARVVQAGYVATGGQIDGVLTSMSLGIYRYIFTSTRPSQVPVTLSTDVKRVAPGGTVNLTGTITVSGYPRVTVQQRRANGPWRDVDAFTSFYGPSFFRSETAPSKLGVVDYRIVVAASNANLRTVSRPVSVRVVPGSAARHRHGQSHAQTPGHHHSHSHSHSHR